MTVQWDWLVPLALCWLGLLTRLAGPRRGRATRAGRWMSVALTGLVASMTLQLAVVHPAVDALTAPGLAAMASNCLTVLALAAAGCTFLHLELPAPVAAPRVARWLVLGLAVCAVLVVLFLTAPSNYPEYVARSRGADPVPLVSWEGYGYVAYVAPAAVLLGASAWRCARVADRFTLRLGLRIMGAGDAVAAAYAVTRCAGMVAYDAGVRGSVLYGPLVGLLFRLAILLVLLGLALPLAGRPTGMDRVARWVALNRQYRLLFPLWHALRSEFPDISLDPSPRRLPFAAPDGVLYRRMIEIWDGLLCLRPYVDGAMDAVAVHRALACRHAGERARGGTAPAAPAGDEVAELTELARRYRVIARARGPARL
ncbi:MAB_1171c family putative transporter [Actinophytocola sp.]|uniref:MAB_1171c family putative transporter n=1 Tax=Actinophytocola sp. TaxID=1872138 RepID=UPI003899B817